MSSKCTKSIFINTELERNQVFSEVNDTHVVELDETRKNVLNSKFWEIGTSYSHETGQHSLKVNSLENFTMARNLAVCPWRNIHDLVNLPNYVDLHVFPSFWKIPQSLPYLKWSGTNGEILRHTLYFKYRKQSQFWVHGFSSQVAFASLRWVLELRSITPQVEELAITDTQSTCSSI